MHIATISINLSIRMPHSHSTLKDRWRYTNSKTCSVQTIQQSMLYNAAEERRKQLFFRCLANGERKREEQEEDDERLLNLTLTEKKPNQLQMEPHTSFCINVRT